MITITVDNRKIDLKQEVNLLEACLENGIYIPNLCHLRHMRRPPASCRFCFVEIEGEPRPLTACTTQAQDGMVVKTDTPAVRRLQRTGLKLLLSAHHVDCGHCPANKNCALQRLAAFLKVGLKPKALVPAPQKSVCDSSHPCLNYYPNRCVLCGKCIYVCRTKHGRARMAMAQRGLKTVISFYGQSAQLKEDCAGCRDCIDICPVGALIGRNLF